MKRRDFIHQSVNFLAGSFLLPDFYRQILIQANSSILKTRPNIVLIVADDLGYNELGIYGCKDIPTPHIDSIGKNGVRFTNGYVSCPVCSPTRAGLLTGRYQQRFGHEFNPGPGLLPTSDFGLPLTETTLPQRLKAVGYKTGMFGKWHLGNEKKYHPLNRGFDEFYGFLGGAHTYFPGYGGKRGSILRGFESTDDCEFTTTAFAKEAVQFIQKHQEEPFFVYLPFNAVHSPLESTVKYLNDFKHIKDKKRRTFAAMLSSLDDSVGTVLFNLKERKLDENTLIIFISDNGGPTLQTSSRNNPLKGYKGQLFEGGIRVPYMMQWKNQLPEGKLYKEPVISLDISPTILAATGNALQEKDKIDGINLLPYLKGKNNNSPHETLYWRFGPQYAVRKGDWKLIRPASGNPQLYNLSRDISESKDLSQQNSKKFNELQSLYEQWNTQLAEPRWQRGKRARPNRPKKQIRMNQTI